MKDRSWTEVNTSWDKILARTRAKHLLWPVCWFSPTRASVTNQTLVRPFQLINCTENVMAERKNRIVIEIIKQGSFIVLWFYYCSQLQYNYRLLPLSDCWMLPSKSTVWWQLRLCGRIRRRRLQVFLLFFSTYFSIYCFVFDKISLSWYLFAGN